jgi:hypothetical protein
MKRTLFVMLLLPAAVLSAEAKPPVFTDVCQTFDYKKDDPLNGVGVPCFSSYNEKTKADTFSVGTKKIVVQHLDQRQGVYERIKINGKPGLQIEKDRTSYTIIADDLSLEFTRDQLEAVEASKVPSFDGMWTSFSGDLKTGCTAVGGEYPSNNYTIRKATIESHESSCKVTGYKRFGTTYYAFASCKNEGEAASESYALSRQDKSTLTINGQTHKLCPAR